MDSIRNQPWLNFFGQLIDAVRSYKKNTEQSKKVSIRLELFQQRFIDLSKLSTGDTFLSPGGLFCYQVVGPICRLYDREELPWPCCRIAFRGKEPSWNRIGRRLVADIAAKTKPSYYVLQIDPITRKPVIGMNGEPVYLVFTLFWVRLSEKRRLWWVTPPGKLKHLI